LGINNLFFDYTNATLINIPGIAEHYIFYVAIDGLLLIDTFMTDSGDINYVKRADMIGHLEDVGFQATVTDLSKGFITDGDEFSLTIGADGMAFLQQSPAGPPGEEVFVGSTGKHKVFSEDKFNYVILDVVADNLPALAKTMSIEGGSEIQDDVMHLSRIVYSTKFGFILGSTSEHPAIPVIVNKRTTGTVDDTIISENLLERYIQGPRNELRGSGIIRDLDIKEITDNGDNKTCSIDVNPGVGVINGVRVEYLGINNLFFDYTNATLINIPGIAEHYIFYVAIDGKGCLLVAPEIEVSGKWISPFFNQNVAHIARITISKDWVSEPGVRDLRLFVDHLDYKAIGNITVANDQRFGHFTDIEKAVVYARTFSKIFPNMVRPSIFIKEGEYEVSKHITIDFDVKISGSGPGTVIKRSESYPLTGTTMLYDNNWDHDAIFKLGFNGTVSDINIGVTLENLAFRGVANQVAGRFGTVIKIVNNINIGNSSHAVFNLNNLRFIAHEDYESGAGASDAGPNEFPIHIGRLANGTYQNILINNCYFNGMGYEKSVVYLNGGNTYKNISVSNCISVDSIDEGSGYSILGFGGGSTLTNVNEIGCMIIGV